MYELEDDMDELFRRAAKDYPLDTNTADWNKLQEAMQKADASGEGIITPIAIRKRKRKLLWLLLLLPLPWVCYEYSNNRNGVNSELAQANGNGKAVVITNTGKTGNGNRNNSPMIEKQDAQSISSPASLAEASGSVRTRYYSNLSNKKTRDKSPVPVENQKELEDNNNNTVQTLKAESTSSSPITPTINKEEKQNTDSIPVKSAVEKKEQKQQENKKDKKTEKQINKVKRFYIGIAGGPDLSTVKLQAIKNVGFNGGLVIGYQWNKRFSVETNIILNKKYYYSEGQYFNTEKIYLPPNTKIGKVAGDCKMIEWAVNLRYNLNTTWSAMAGLSSYFMKKEDYNYQYVYNNGQTADRYRTYNNESTHWLSVINLGLTYSHSLGRTGSLRIEPYLKLPVEGLGIGSLPIMSTGLNVGFIKKIF